MFREAVAENKGDEFKAVIDEAAQDWKHEPAAQALVKALDKILSGVRDRAVVDDFDLGFDDAAEVLLILEELEW